MSTKKQKHATDKKITMETSPNNLVRLARLLQFSDSMLPVGTFAFSNGLESAIQTEVVKDKQSLEQFVELVVRQSARMDGVALLNTFRSASSQDYDGVLAADQAIWNRRVGEEQQLMIARMGKKLAELVLKISDFPVVERWLADINAGNTPGSYPVGQALVFAQLGATETEAFTVHQYGVASMILSASIRLMRIDHIDTQRILYSISDRVMEDYEAVSTRSLDDISVFAPVFDVLVAHHTKAHVRLFMN